MSNKQHDQIKRKFNEFQNLTESQKVKYRCAPQLTGAKIVTFHYLNIHTRQLSAFKIASLDAILDDMIANEILTEIPREVLLEKYGIKSRMKYYYKGKSWDETKKPFNPRTIFEILKGVAQSTLNPTQCLILAAVGANHAQPVIALAHTVEMGIASVTQHLIILTKLSFLEKRDNFYYLTNQGTKELCGWTNIKLVMLPPTIPVSTPPAPPIPEKPRFLDWSIPTINLQSAKEAQLRAAAWIAETKEERIANNILRSAWDGLSDSQRDDFPQNEEDEIEGLDSVY